MPTGIKAVYDRNRSNGAPKQAIAIENINAEKGSNLASDILFFMVKENLPSLAGTYVHKSIVLHVLCIMCACAVYHACMCCVSCVHVLCNRHAIYVCIYAVCSGMCIAQVFEYLEKGGWQVAPSQGHARCGSGQADTAIAKWVISLLCIQWNLQ